MIEGYSLIAHVVNAHDPNNAEVALEVASESQGEWYTNDGSRVWPFWTAALDSLMTDTKDTVDKSIPARLMETIPPIPDNWFAYLEEEAIKFAKGKSVNLLTSLGLSMPPPKPKVKIVRRI